MDRSSRKASGRRSRSFQANSASPPPLSSSSVGTAATGAVVPTPSSPAGATGSNSNSTAGSNTAWQPTSSSKAHSQLNPHHHQRQLQLQQQHRRRSIGRNSSHGQSLTFSTPEPKDAAHGAAASMSSRKRTRTGDSSNSLNLDYNTPEPEPSPADEDAGDGPTKGGHSLRKRARVQYAAEQIDDEVTVPNSTSSSASRNRRRHTHHVQDDEDLYGARPKRRNTSHSDTPTSSLRRNPARRNTTNRRYQDASDPDDFSAVVEDDPQWGAHEQNQEHQNAMAATTGAWQSAESSPSSRVNRANASYSNQTASDQSGLQNHVNGDGLQSPTLFSSPVAVTATPIMTGDAINAYGHQTQNSEFYDPDQQMQYEPDQQLQNESMIDYPDLAPDMDDPLATGTSSLPAPTHARHPDMFEYDENMHPDDPAIYEDNIASRAMLDQAQSAEATPPVDPQLMALMDPSASQNGEKTPAKTVESTAASPQPFANEQLREKSPSIDEAGEEQQDGSTPVKERSATGASTPTRTTPGATMEPEKLPKDTLELTTKDSSLRESVQEEPSMEKPAKLLDARWCRPQPTPVGRWSRLTPYINGEYTVYPEKKPRPEDDDAASEAPSATDKDSDEKDSGKEGEAEPVVEESGDAQETVTELPTPALNTPTRGSPVAEVPDLAAINSPMPPGEEPEDLDSSQDTIEKSKHFRFRKLNDPEEFVSALQNYEEMSTEDLYELLQVANASLQTWEEEYVEHGKTVDDYENAQRRRTADIKYENRTRNLNQVSITWEEPDFAVKGYKAKERERMTETKYLQGQDRLMAAAYGFEYDPHPSKIGKQNPETQQAGVTTRGRSLRNQPRQTAKATETDGVVGKRQRKPVQVLEIATQDTSRASSPAPGRGGRRRRNVNPEIEETAPEPTSSFNSEGIAEPELTGPGRRRRAPRGKAGAPRIVETLAPEEEPRAPEPPKPTGRRGRPRANAVEEDAASRYKDEPQEPVQNRPRRIVTLKIPRGANRSPSTTITDNGASPPQSSTAVRPSTAGSDTSTQTVESAYAFRPKRQKRFRDEPEDTEGGPLAPARKRTRKAATPIEDRQDQVMRDRQPTTAEDVAPSTEMVDEQSNEQTKPRIKVVRPGSRSGQSSAAVSTSGPTPPPPAPTASASEGLSRNGTPASQPTTDGDDGLPKEYRTMTKSEKMSASMKNRWKNGNMAGAVEKRKATLAAKKAAQAANEQRIGLLAPKQPKGRGAKKETTLLPGENAAFLHHQPAGHPHLAHNQHPHQHIQSMPPLTQQPLPHHSHQMPQHPHQHIHHQPHPYGHQEHPSYAPQHQYGQPMPQPHHPHHLPPHQHHQPHPPPHHHVHQHQPQQHPQYPPHHEYPGGGRPFSG